MNKIQFTSMPTDQAVSYQAGRLDAHGQVPETHISDGSGIPCRHCQQEVTAGDAYLILAYLPFDSLQPYAEMGPIFLHADSCQRYAESDDMPPMFLSREAFLLKGYGTDNRIIYGTGKIVKTSELTSYATELLDDPVVAYVHVRSALNNCFTCRIDRMN